MLFGKKKIFDKRLWANLGKTALVTVGIAAVVSAAAAIVSPFGAAGIVAGAAAIAPFEYWVLFKRGQTHELALETGADTYDRVMRFLAGRMPKPKLPECHVMDYVQQVRNAYAYNHAYVHAYAMAGR